MAGKQRLSLAVKLIHMIEIAPSDLLGTLFDFIKHTIMENYDPLIVCIIGRLGRSRIVDRWGVITDLRDQKLYGAGLRKKFEISLATFIEKASPEELPIFLELAREVEISSNLDCDVIKIALEGKNPEHIDPEQFKETIKSLNLLKEQFGVKEKNRQKSKRPKKHRP